MRSLRTKITAIPVAAIIASLLAAALVGGLTVGREVGESSAEQMHLLSENARLSLDTYLNDIEQGVEITSHFATGSLDAALLMENGAKKRSYERKPEQTEVLDGYLKEHCAYVERAFANVAGHTDGITSYFYCIRPEICTTEKGFYFSRKGKVGFERLAPLDASGLDPLDSEHNSWYYVPIERGTPCWVGPYRAQTLGDTLTVSYLMPVYKSGILIGVLGMDIPFDTMVEQLKSLRVYDTGYACLLDSAGNVLYHPDYGTSAAQHPEAPVFTDVKFAQESSGTRAIFYDRDGKQWQMSYSTLGNGMRLVITAPVNEINASWNNLLKVEPVVAVLILAIFIPIALGVTRMVSEPLQELTDAAHRLSDGDYDIELDYHGNDEVGDLTDAFRQLRDHLTVYTSNLNSTSFLDEATGVKNAQAFELAASQLDDAVRMADVSSAQFAIAVFDHLDLANARDFYGRASANESLQVLCHLLGRVFSRESVFRLDDSVFAVVLQGRNFANREELMCDFDVLAAENNAEAVAPWLFMRTAQGLATFDAAKDEGAHDVLERARLRMRTSDQAHG